MTSRCSIEKQQLTLMKEDLSLKRKLSETTNSVDQEFLQNNNKMIKTMENLGNAISNCVDLMKRMHDSQQAPLPENYGRPLSCRCIVIMTITWLMSPLAMGV